MQRNLIRAALPSGAAQSIAPPIAPMAAWPQWLCWAAFVDPAKPNKIQKLPLSPVTGQYCDVKDRSSYGTAEQAMAYAVAYGLGLGFAFTPEDPFFFLDLDSCGTNGSWLPHVSEVLRWFPGAAVEVSCSWRGIHVFGRCPPGIVHSCKNASIQGELYTENRFVALGNSATGSSSIDFSAYFQSFVDSYFPPREGGSDDWREGPRDEWTGPDDDEELIRRALKSESGGSVFGNKASFADLWNRNVDKLALAFPSNELDKEYGYSEADMALASHLAFWTGDDCPRILKLMHQSELKREKWDRQDYLERFTIPQVLGGDVYDKPPADLDGQEVDGSFIRRRTGYQYLSFDAQVEYFEGCTFIANLNRVMMENGNLYNRDQFRALKNGYVFPIDDTEKQKTTKDAWEAFSSSQVIDYPIAHGLSFRPLCQERLIDRGEDGIFAYANTWRDPHVVKTEGDPLPFWRHLKMLLPNGDDAMILLAYLAAIVQHQGVKFAWAVVLQGVQGNGKSTIARIMEYCIGKDYHHPVRGSTLGEKFNAWMSRTILAVVEDVRISSERSEVMETLKTWITEKSQTIERKGVDQVKEDVCFNFFFTTNHRDAVPLVRSERRFCIFYSAQQKIEDLARDGLTEQYFFEFNRWLNNGGFAIVAQYLSSYPIPEELNPATHCVRAPISTAHEQALQESLSPMAQVIQEAIMEDRPGFRGNWISTGKASQLLRDKGFRTAPRTVGKLLATLGFIQHPNLNRGRTPAIVAAEGGRTSLWVLDGDPTAQLIDPAEVQATYESAQGYQSIPGASNVIPIRQ